MDFVLYLGRGEAKEPDRPWWFPFILLAVKSIKYSIKTRIRASRSFWTVDHAGVHTKNNSCTHCKKAHLGCTGKKHLCLGLFLPLPACIFKSFKISFMITIKCKHSVPWDLWTTWANQGHLKSGWRNLSLRLAGKEFQRLSLTWNKLGQSLWLNCQPADSDTVFSSVSTEFY